MQGSFNGDVKMVEKATTNLDIAKDPKKEKQYIATKEAQTWIH